MMLSFVDETLGYGANPVLRRVNLALHGGERVALLGRSGAGKSTLLAAIRAKAEGAGIASALVPQDHALVPVLSAYHNIYMGRLNRHSTWHNLITLLRPFTRDRDAIGKVAAALEIAPLLPRPVDELSGGQRQRVAVGRALYAGGALLLADEPVSALDETQAPRVLATLAAAFATGVVALHDVALARQYATRLIGLKGQILLFDAPPDKIDEMQIEALYAA